MCKFYLPLINKKCYNDASKLSSLEKDFMVMATTDRKLAKELARGDNILEKYIEEAKKVENYDEFLREAYDHEQSSLLAEREIGIEEGREIGKEEGKTSVIMVMLKRGVSIEDICNLTGYRPELIETIAKSLIENEE